MKPEEKNVTDVQKRFDEARVTDHEVFPDKDSSLTGDLTRDVDQEIDQACSIDYGTEACTASGRGWNRPPTIEEVQQAYANQAFGLQQATGTLTYEEHYKILDQARQEFMRDRDFHDEERRSQALHAAISYMQEGKSPETVVKAAEAFHAFLKGEVLF